MNNDSKVLDVVVRRGRSLELLLTSDDGVRRIRRGVV